VGRFVFNRILQMIPIVFGISAIVFLSMRLVPGDICYRIHGIKVAPEVIENCRQQLSLDQPIYVQYYRYLEGLLAGNLGYSLIFRRPALELILERLPVTLYLAMFSMLLAVLISMPVGILAAVKRDSWVDHLIRGGTTLSLSLPHFVIALGLMLVFSIRLKLFPVSGYGRTPAEVLHHLFLPSLTLAVTVAVLLARGLRSSLIEILGEDYIRTARGKGVPRQLLFRRHSLPNALVSYVSLIGLNLVVLVGATVIVEQVFALPGLGSLMVTSIFNRDYEVVQSITLIFALLVVAINLITDLSYAYIDPRIRYE